MANSFVFRRSFLTAFVVLNGIATANAAVPNSFFVEITVSGAQRSVKTSDRQKDPYRYYMFMRYEETDTDDMVGGSHAGFGVFDSGEVVLMHYEEYTPSFAEATYTRGVHTDKRGFGLADMPRYIMVCAWSDQDETSSPRMFRSYAERDDAGLKARDAKGNHSTISIRYRPVPTRRVQDKFSAHDYCAEISAAGKVSVPYWLPPKFGL